MKQSIKIPGFNIRAPWSSYILTKEKAIETRGYPLPKKYQNIPIAIIETGSKIKPAPVTGIVVFSNSFAYENFSKWKKDFKRHLVPESDGNFGFHPLKRKYGWELKEVWPLKYKIPGPKKKGIRFAAECSIPLSAIPKDCLKTLKL